jgi:hypothetical protein
MEDEWIRHEFGPDCFCGNRTFVSINESSVSKPMSKKTKKQKPPPPVEPPSKTRTRKKKIFTVLVTDKEAKVDYTVFVSCHKKSKAERIGILTISDFHDLKTSQLVAKAENTPGVTKGLDPNDFHIFVAMKR